MKNRVVVVGSYNTDLTIKTKRIPQPGETVIGGNFFQGGGGKGANQAVASARAGATVSFVARVGNDVLGKEAVQQLAQEGINTQFVVQDEHYPTGVAFILVDERGENSIAVASGANARLSPADIEKAKAEIASAGVILLQLESPPETVQHAIDLAHKSGTLVILNPAPAGQLNGLSFNEVNIITPNIIEAEMLSGEKISTDESLAVCARKILRYGIQNVIITLGERGVFLASANTMDLISAYQISAIDSTGAGDVFSGSLAAFLAEGKSIQEAVKMAMASATISVTRMGAQPSAPYRSDIENFISHLAESRSEIPSGSIHK
jgi:ribokinase